MWINDHPQKSVDLALRPKVVAIFEGKNKLI